MTRPTEGSGRGGAPANGSDGPGGPDGPDAFDLGRADAEALRDALDGVREDVAALVRQEVARAGMSRSELERMVQEAVAREARRHGAGSGSRPAWLVPALAGGGLVVGLALGVIGYRALAPDGPGPRDPATLATTPAGPMDGPADGPAARSGSGAEPEGTPGGTPGSAGGAARATPSLAPAERAALYDSLLAAGSERLEPLMARLEAAAPAAPVTGALQAWRAGTALDEASRRRLHDALVQLALNEEAGAGLALDGLLTRGPCGGNSCGALLELWRARGEELGMPALPADPATDDSTLAVAERVLVLRRVEEGGAP